MLKRTIVTSFMCFMLLALAFNAQAEEPYVQPVVPSEEGERWCGGDPLEWSDGELPPDPSLGDKDARPPGGPLVYDACQVLYTNVPNDWAGSPWPYGTADYDHQDVPDGEQVDALANRGDAYFWEVTAANRGGHEGADLLVSFDGDPAATPEEAFAVYQEYAAPPLNTNGGLWTQDDLYFEDPQGTPDELRNLDAMELWGPKNRDNPPGDPRKGWDTTHFSLQGDPQLVADGDPARISVRYYDATWTDQHGSPYITQLQIHAAVVSLGGFGCPAEEIDLDALMVRDVNPVGEWGPGDMILFSIKAACGWDGGEIVYLPFGGPAAFLFHGGHLWDTAYDIQFYFGVDTEEVDAIEAATEFDVHEIYEPRWNVQQGYVNTTGQTAYDLTKILRGNVQVDGAYHDAFAQHVVVHLPGPPELTVIHFFDGSVPPGGFTWACFWGRGLPVPIVQSVFWTDDSGNNIGTAGPGLGMVGISDVGVARVEISHNMCNWCCGYPVVEGDDCVSDFGPITMTNVYYAITDVYRQVEELNEAIYTDPTIDWIPVDEYEGAVLNVGDTVTTRIPMPIIDTDQPPTVVLYRLVASGEGMTTEEILQFRVTRSIPAVTAWGLLVMALLGLVAGTIMFRKARAVAA